MTALETWIMGMVKVVMRDRPPAFEAPTAEEWVSMEQRIAILLVQARALECRHLAGELAVGGANHPVAIQIMKACWDRSHKLEAIGFMLAKQYPPVDGNEIMVCRCAMDHGEVQVDVPGGMKGEGAMFPFVCAQCKLPKHGTSGNQPVMVTQ